MSGKLISRRKLLALAVTTSAGALLAACGAAPATTTNSATTEPAPAAPTEAPVAVATTVAPTEVAAAAEPTPTVATDANVIDWWESWGDPGSQALEEVARAWNAEGNGFTIVRTRIEDVSQTLLSAIAGGVPPDVETGGVFYAELYARGAFQPLDELIDTSKAFKRTDIFDTSWNYSGWQGTTYGVPSVESFLRYALVLNADLAKKAGLDPTKPPETWDDAFEWHTQMTEFDGAGNVKVVGLDPLDSMGGWWDGGNPSFWPIDYGFDYWDPQAKKYNLDNPQFIAALNVIKRFYDHVGAKKMTTFRNTTGSGTGDPMAAFPSGRQGMIINGYWAPGELAKTAPDKNFVYSWVPVPTERKGKKVQATGGHNSGIPKGATKADRGWKYIEYLTTDKAIDIIFKSVGWLGASKSYLDTLDTSAYKGLDWYVKSFKEANDMRGMDVDPLESFTNTEWTDDVQQLIFSKLSPEDVAKKMQAALTQQLQARGI